jgi:phage-related protein
VWLHGEVKSPPLSREARLEAGYLLRRMQDGESLHMPWSRAMPSIGPQCHELRMVDVSGSWRIIYRVDPDAIVVARGLLKESSGNTEVGHGCLSKASAFVR